MLQNTHLKSVAECDIARIGVFNAGYDVEQCRFSRAVFCDNAYLVAFIYAKRDAVKQHPVAVTFSEIVNLEEACGHIPLKFCTNLRIIIGIVWNIIFKFAINQS